MYDARVSDDECYELVDTQYEVKLSNIVVSGVMDLSRIDIEKIFIIIEENYPTISIDLKSQRLILKTEKYGALIHHNGVFFIAGKFTLEDLDRTVNDFVNFFSQITGTDIKLLDYKIVNIVATSRLKHDVINLENFALFSTMNVEYDPDIFSSAIVRLDGFVLLIFNNGNVVINGISDIYDIHKVKKVLFDIDDQIRYISNELGVTV